MTSYEKTNGTMMAMLRDSISRRRVAYSICATASMISALSTYIVQVASLIKFKLGRMREPTTTRQGEQQQSFERESSDPNVALLGVLLWAWVGARRKVGKGDRSSLDHSSIVQGPSWFLGNSTDPTVILSVYR